MTDLDDASPPVPGARRRSSSEELAAQLERTVDRVRGMALTRLAAAFEPEPTRADAVRALAQRIEDAAAGVEGRGGRDLPRLGDPAVAHQLAVVGHDLLAAGAAAPAPATDEVLSDAASWLLDLRRRL